MNELTFTCGSIVYQVPRRMWDSIDRYVIHHARPGSFLTAIICNNLKEAVMFADEENMQNIPAYVNYFYNHAPANCWGSKKIMDKWLEGRDD